MRNRISALYEKYGLQKQSNKASLNSNELAELSLTILLLVSTLPEPLARNVVINCKSYSNTALCIRSCSTRFVQCAAGQ